MGFFNHGVCARVDVRKRVIAVRICENGRLLWIELPVDVLVEIDRPTLQPGLRSIPHSVAVRVFPFRAVDFPRRINGDLVVLDLAV